MDIEGKSDGVKVGSTEMDGVIDGINEGLVDGTELGRFVGNSLGLVLGTVEGLSVIVGKPLGAAVGDRVVLLVCHITFLLSLSKLNVQSRFI